MTEQRKKELLMFFAVLAVVSTALGFSDGLFSNYFKEAYGVDGFQRGIIEFPRELPGVIVYILISAIAWFGDITIAIIAQGLAAAGLVALGFFTPSFAVMMVFVFVNSMGTHLYMPLQDSISITLAEPEKLGTRMGQFAGIRFAFLMLSGVVVYFLFHFKIFNFYSPQKWTFVVAAVFYAAALLLLVQLRRKVGHVQRTREKVKLLFRKEYKYYYLISIVYGVQKQVMLVFGPWVLIETLGQQTDTIVLLTTIASLLGIFFMPRLGKWLDRFGIKKMLYVDAISFIAVYLCYGVMTQFFSNGLLSKSGIPLILICALFVIDRLSSQMGIIRTLYLKSIAKNAADITPTISFAMMLDHIVSIAVGVTGGLLWVTIGSQYIFYTVAALSLVNLAVAIVVKEPAKAAYATMNTADALDAADGAADL